MPKLTRTLHYCPPSSRTRRGWENSSRQLWVCYGDSRAWFHGLKRGADIVLELSTEFKPGENYAVQLQGCYHLRVHTDTDGWIAVNVDSKLARLVETFLEKHSSWPDVCYLSLRPA